MIAVPWEAGYCVSRVGYDDEGNERRVFKLKPPQQLRGGANRLERLAWERAHHSWVRQYGWQNYVAETYVDAVHPELISHAGGCYVRVDTEIGPLLVFKPVRRHYTDALVGCRIRLTFKRVDGLRLVHDAPTVIAGPPTFKKASDDPWHIAWWRQEAAAVGEKIKRDWEAERTAWLAKRAQAPAVVGNPVRPK